MKTYTGVEAIERMKTNWIMKKDDKRIREYAYKLEDGKLLVKVDGENTNDVLVGIEFFFAYEFVDYVEGLGFEEGEVFVFMDELNHCKWYARYVEQHGYIIDIDLAADISEHDVSEGEVYYLDLREGTARKATDEELEEFGRFMAFYRKGRKMNEFKVGDYEGQAYVVTNTKADGLEVSLINSDETTVILPEAFEPHFFVEDIVG
ncbi:hypothetical protein P4U05_17030 [Bacillus paranthracis]|uniref:hypothetical protein n=1 Tax=Bacillus phage phi4B1 TaxID=1643324 RepID=UPI000200F414|nr:hypothetical protein [Bacillus paranthracis]YP_009206346.1 hypothetical protein XO26_0047 [Bacillus phage phi4B1]ADY20340.1 group-specific protein [Bacillus thuringiensis serovar finitimus YBT-020]OTX71284.1 hypothetical protein BK722_12790 [Bacillus thuringiensis serovar finitimus]ALF02570.1 hypothetical protein XO26_0047 [Bacillus phage phi4B1]MCR6799381.1 hypothetical protein [Bacillus paranthracis]MEC3358459.1 hypothetical protein [Bacillus paranthracis]